MFCWGNITLTSKVQGRDNLGDLEKWVNSQPRSLPDEHIWDIDKQTDRQTDTGAYDNTPLAKYGWGVKTTEMSIKFMLHQHTVGHFDTNLIFN